MFFFFFFFNDTATTEIYTLSLHELFRSRSVAHERQFEWWQLQSIDGRRETVQRVFPRPHRIHSAGVGLVRDLIQDRKSTRLNSSHSQISYAVFCLKKKKKSKHQHINHRS